LREIVSYVSGVIACAGVACGGNITTYDVVSAPRDWAAHPAIAEVDTASVLYAISDVHGGYERLATLLANANVTAGVPDTASSIHWAANDAVLVVAGDMFDKGPQGIEVIDALIALDASAAGQGGRVIVTLGNHEAEFLADPTNGKADSSDGIDAELGIRGIDPIQIASGADPRGAWLRDLPFGVKVGGWFFAHAGNTKQRGIADLEAAIHADVEANDYAGNELIGDDSLLESRDWFETANAGSQAAHAVGAAHLVFGHSPHALGADGDIAMAEAGALFRIDCGMSPEVGYSDGVLLRVRHEGEIEVAEAVAASGAVRELWRGQAP
jgi:hypothetical protein